MALPYTAANLTTMLSTVVDTTNNVVKIFAKDVTRESLERQQFFPFMGGPESVVHHRKDLEVSQGDEIRFPLIKEIDAISNAPYQGDRDTHNLEVQIKDTAETVTIKEWRLPTMAGRAERQKPVWDFNEETKQAIINYVKDRKDLHILYTAMGLTIYDGESSPVAIWTGETPTNVIYPEGCDSLDDITNAHTFTIEQLAAAKEVLEEGYLGTTQVWRGMAPKVAGESIDGVLFLHPFSKFDLRWDDAQRFEGWLLNARERGTENPIWRGIPDKFVVDNVLVVTLRPPLSRAMLRTTSTWSATPQTQVAINLYMTAQAVCRATCIEDILDLENWDGKQFTRAIGGSYEGIVKTRFGRDAANATMKDFGLVALPCAANAHNTL